MSPRAWFWIRLVITAVVVLVVWTLIARFYEGMVKSIIMSLIQSAGYYRDFEQKVSDALMSPAIPFVTLMIGTWGTRLFWKDGKFNWSLVLWFIIGTFALITISVTGQYLSFMMSLTENDSAFMTNLTGFLIATAPVLLPIVLWTVLSYKEIGRIFRK